MHDARGKEAAQRAHGEGGAMHPSTPRMRIAQTLHTGASDMRSRPDKRPPSKTTPKPSTTLLHVPSSPDAQLDPGRTLLSHGEWWLRRRPKEGDLGCLVPRFRLLKATYLIFR